jgi:hypothetical protein
VQRQQKNKGRLNADRQKRLEEIGVVWIPLEERRQHKLRLLEQFKNREGHCNVPRSHKEDGSKLGNWLNKQRHQKNKGRLNADIQKRLEEIGVVWSQFEEQWEHMLGLLEKFKNREGHCNVPRSHKEDDSNLGTWLHNQRAAKRKGGLLSDRERRLEALGVVWRTENGN